MKRFYMKKKFKIKQFCKSKEKILKIILSKKNDQFNKIKEKYQIHIINFQKFKIELYSFIHFFTSPLNKSQS